MKVGVDGALAVRAPPPSRPGLLKGEERAGGEPVNCGTPEHSQLLLQGQVLGGQGGTTGEEAANEQPDCLENAHPWTSTAGPNSRILRPIRPQGNTRKSFARKADGVFDRDKAHSEGSKGFLCNADDKLSPGRRVHVACTIYAHARLKRKKTGAANSLLLPCLRH